MTKNLVIVESPAKAKTIKKYLGKDFEVMASYGHVRDLVPKEGAVDPTRQFAMRWELIEKNKKHVDAITRAVKKADALYLSTDPDREGEAISWHLQQLLTEAGALEGKTVHRSVFYEITKNAVQEAVDNPREIADELVKAYLARRALDFLVGFNLSPLLWKKAGLSGASAGRVQSPALRMICEREEEILAFKPREYWSIDAQAAKDSANFTAKLTQLGGQKVEQFTVTDAGGAEAAKQKLERDANGTLVVANVEKKQRKRNPSPPFTTSTLQQEAARKLGFGAQRTMRLAQRLYEGVDFGEGPVGLITYMRTDSVSLGADAISEIRSVIGKLYGKAALPDTPRVYKTKSKNAQEAHEGVRPTSAAVTPEQLAGKIEADEHKLYTLIWRRAVASQMEAAVFDTVAVDLAAGPGNMFRANGSTLLSPGFLAVYRESFDDVSLNPDDDENRLLPALEKGDKVRLLAIDTEQHFTEPPPRYSEASLVKALEEHGIGRPSTYASIIQTLLYKKYCELVNKRFIPTDLGKIVSRFLTGNFERYVDYGFTAAMEDELDNISRGEEDWLPMLERFWDDLKKQVDDVTENVTRSDVAMERPLGIDPVSGRPVSVRYGRFGAFAQIGTREDEEKPKFASLKPGQRMDDLTLDLALELFQLPRTLGSLGRRLPDQGGGGPLRSVRAVRRQEVRVAQEGRRPVHGHARARARDHPRKADDRGEPDHQGVRRRRRPGAERPLRPVHHRRQEERQDPEGSRPEFADARGMPGAARRGAGTRHESLGPQDGCEDHGQDGCEGDRTPTSPAEPKKKTAAKKKAAPKKKAAAKKEGPRREEIVRSEDERG